MMMMMMMLLQRYEQYLAHEQQMLIALDAECQENRTFDRIYREFEAQKVCYLPVNAFLLKPAQRLLHYELIINSQSMLCLLSSVYTQSSGCAEFPCCWACNQCCCPRGKSLSSRTNLQVFVLGPQVLVLVVVFW